VFLLHFEFRVYVLLQNQFRVLVKVNGFWFRVRVLIKKPFFKRKHHSLFENFVSRFSYSCYGLLFV